MPSELSRQVALHRSRFGGGAKESSQKSRPQTVSFLYDPRDAAFVDAHAIYEQAALSFECLQQQQPLLELFQSLFESPDRREPLQFQDPQKALATRRQLCLLCSLLSPFFLERDCHCCIEFLLREYRLHEEEPEALLLLALPFHESLLFARLLQLLRLPEASPWFGLRAAQKAGAPVPQSAIYQIVLKSPAALQSLAAAVREALLPLSDLIRDGEVSVPARLAAAASSVEGRVFPEKLLNLFSSAASGAVAASASARGLRAMAPSLFGAVGALLQSEAALCYPQIHRHAVLVVCAFALRWPLQSALLQRLVCWMVKPVALQTSERLQRRLAKQTVEVLLLLLKTQSERLRVLERRPMLLLSKCSSLVDSVQEVRATLRGWMKREEGTRRTGGDDRPRESGVASVCGMRSFWRRLGATSVPSSPSSSTPPFNSCKSQARKTARFKNACSISSRPSASWEGLAGRLERRRLLPTLSAQPSAWPTPSERLREKALRRRPRP